MRQIWSSSLLAVATLLTSGCVAYWGTWSATDTETWNTRYLEAPTVEDFTQRQLSFKVAGDQDTVSELLVMLLSESSLFHKVEVRSPDTYVITAFVLEPKKAGERRIRKSAFRFDVGQASGLPPCVIIGVTWLTKSRGLREERWSIQATDESYSPAAWPALRAALQQERCKQ